MPASTTGSMIVQIELEQHAVFSEILRWISVDTLWKPPLPSPDATSRPRCVRLSTGPAQVDGGEDREQRRASRRRRARRASSGRASRAARRGDRVRGHHREHAADVGAEERRAVDDDRDAEQRDRDQRAAPAADAVRRAARRAAPRPPRAARSRGCRARRSGPATVGEYPNTVLNCSRAPVATSTRISPTRMLERDDQRRDARPIGREPRDQRDRGADAEQEQPVRPGAER